MHNFADNLRKRAAELGISNAEVARRADLSERRYGNYVTGRREPDFTTLLRIAAVLETTPNVLLGLAEPEPVGKDPLRDRINAALAALGEADKELIAACTDAIVRLRQSQKESQKV